MEHYAKQRMSGHTMSLQENSKRPVSGITWKSKLFKILHDLPEGQIVFCRCAAKASINLYRVNFIKTLLSDIILLCNSRLQILDKPATALLLESAAQGELHSTF